MLAFDHVIMVSNDIQSAAARLLATHGLASVEGGRHDGMGTANRIVPLGRSYLEIIGVLDEQQARTSALGRWVASHAAEGDRLIAVCLRTDSLDEIAARLGEEPVAMTRTRPDGVVLRWRMVGFDRMLADPGQPFFITWEVAPGLHPGVAPASHRIRPGGIEWVETAADHEQIRQLTGDDSLDLRAVPGGDGVRAAGITTDSGVITLRN